jgi:hypothetical protein
MFQSTPPARRATRRQRELHDALEVSIHAPRAEGDSGPYELLKMGQEFSVPAIVLILAFTLASSMFPVC